MSGMTKMTMKMNKDRVLVFQGIRKEKYERPLIYAIPLQSIQTIRTQWGSQNAWVEVNGVTVDATFDEVLDAIGEPTYVGTTFLKS